MKPFFLLLVLLVSAVLFDILCRPFGHLVTLYQRLQRVPARFTGMRRKTLPATGLAGSFGRPLADDAWHPATQF